MTPDEYAALINLQKKYDIVIKPADKGGAVAVWDRELDIEKATDVTCYNTRNRSLRSKKHNNTLMNYNQLLYFNLAVKFYLPNIFKIFLDMNISLKQGILSTSILYKTTDYHSYLAYHSSHNPSTKNSIPFS